MRSARGFFAALLLLSALGLFAGRTAVASMVLDQSQTTIIGYSAVLNGLYGWQQAQTFQVGMSGRLVQLDIHSYGTAGEQGLSIDIRRATNGPTLDPTDVLQTRTVALDFGWNSFAFNVPVSVNDVLAYVIYGPGVAGLSGAGGSGVDFYEAGLAWKYLPVYEAWITDRPYYNFDLAFRTYVDPVPDPVPLPAAALLLLSGLGALGAIARKRETTNAAA